MDDLQRLKDHADIEALLIRYVNANDADDWQGMIGCVTDDASWGDASPEGKKGAASTILDNAYTFVRDDADRPGRHGAARHLLPRRIRHPYAKDREFEQRAAVRIGETSCALRMPATYPLTFERN
ncbi:MAG: hypothetical protein ABWY26_13240 [Microbacterium sp.]